MIGSVFTSRLWEFRLVFANLVSQHVTLKYRRTALGKDIKVVTEPSTL